MTRLILSLCLVAGFLAPAFVQAGPSEGSSPPLGLPEIPIPEDNPQTPEKIALGKKLFEDKRFSTTGEVACANCHAQEKGFTDGPLKVSEGIDGLTGTRNAPTVLNAAYFSSQFWDGRSPSLEDQALHPFVNPVEMGLADHEPILAIVRTDPEYQAAFQEVFDKGGDQVTMDEVTKAIASFERTLVFGNTRFDRWYFQGEPTLSAQEMKGFDLFVNEGRCVSCHVVEETQALFTDNRFHNIGVGINDIQKDVPELAGAYLEAERTLAEVDVEVLSDARSSELGRFAVTRGFDDLGSFKTSTLRNVAVTAPYFHDGSVDNLRDAVVHYNNGGVTNEGDPVNDFLSGGIRPLNLTDEEIDALVAFLETLTSPEFEALAASQSK